MQKMEFILLLFIATLVLINSSKLPDYIQVCKRSDPEINSCIQNSIENLRPKLISGMPEINVPSIEPLVIDEPIATQGTGIKVVTKNLKAYGGGNFSVTDMDVDPTVPKFNFHISFPYLRLEGSFEVDGKIIMMSFRGSGDMMSDVYDVDCQVEVNCEIVTVNDDQFLKFNDLDLKRLKIGKGKVHLKNLFEKEGQMIGDVINAAINLNFQYFIQELKPVIASTLTHFAVKSVDNIVANVPLNEIFPE